MAPAGSLRLSATIGMDDRQVTEADGCVLGKFASPDGRPRPGPAWNHPRVRQRRRRRIRVRDCSRAPGHWAALCFASRALPKKASQRADLIANCAALSRSPCCCARSMAWCDRTLASFNRPAYAKENAWAVRHPVHGIRVSLGCFHGLVACPRDHPSETQDHIAEPTISESRSCVRMRWRNASSVWFGRPAYNEFTPSSK